MAFALSEILDALRRQQEARARYYDLLAANAFGNFRQLLDDVTFSPVMGIYLSYLENYAREVMQLFTIGLVQLQPDGTLLLDSDGLPIPTYEQATVTEMAKVFTGLSWGGPIPNTRDGAADHHGLLVPMQPVESWHDATQNAQPRIRIPLATRRVQASVAGTPLQAPPRA